MTTQVHLSFDGSKLTSAMNAAIGAAFIHELQTIKPLYQQVFADQIVAYLKTVNFGSATTSQVTKGISSAAISFRKLQR